VLLVELIELTGRAGGELITKIARVDDDHKLDRDGETVGLIKSDSAEENQ